MAHQNIGVLWIDETNTRHRGSHYSAATARLHNSIGTWLLVIYAADQRSPYINHRELTYCFHLFMLAIIYNTVVWLRVIDMLNSNFISSTCHSVLLEQHAFVLKKLISWVSWVGWGGWVKIDRTNESEGSRRSVIKVEFRAEKTSLNSSGEMMLTQNTSEIRHNLTCWAKGFEIVWKKGQDQRDGGGVQSCQTNTAFIYSSLACLQCS